MKGISILWVHFNLTESLLNVPGNTHQPQTTSLQNVKHHRLQRGSNFQTVIQRHSLGLSWAIIDYPHLCRLCLVSDYWLVGNVMYGFSSGYFWLHLYDPSSDCCSITVWYSSSLSILSSFRVTLLNLPTVSSLIEGKEAWSGFQGNLVQ